MSPIIIIKPDFETHVTYQAAVTIYSPNGAKITNVKNLKYECRSLRILPGSGWVSSHSHALQVDWRVEIATRYDVRGGVEGGMSCKITL